jgi:transcriptional regulator, effector binding domain protein
MYAFVYKSNNMMHYIVGSKKKNDSLHKYQIKKGNYAIFEVGTKTQKDITNTIKFINNIWGISSKIEARSEPYIECYTKSNCYICVPLKRNKTDM